MRILQVHNFHRVAGGSDAVARATVELLGNAGHDVRLFCRDSARLSGARGALAAFAGGFASPRALAEFRAVLRGARPDVVHAHDVYPLISPWIFRACRAEGIRSVLTLHDYRMTCPVATHLRAGRICTECIDNGEGRCLWHNCLGATAKNAAYALRNLWARKLRLFDAVDRFLAPSEFTRRWMIENAGLTPDRVIRVGNPVSLPGAPPPYRAAARAYAAFAGRLSPEKGVEVLLQAAELSGIPVRIAGAPDPASHSASQSKPGVSGHAPGPLPGVEFLGALDRPGMAEFYDGARFLVVPSLCYETFGLTAAEAMSRGVPVIVSSLGALAEIADAGAGAKVPPGDADALAAAMTVLWNDPDRLGRMSESALKAAAEFDGPRYAERVVEAYGI